MTRSSSSRGARRLRLAATILCGVLALPGLAVADHTACDGTTANPCPPLAVDLSAGPQLPYAGTWSGITFRFNQPDESMPVLDVDYLVPAGWGFAVQSLRPAQRNDGGAGPAQCSSDPNAGIFVGAVGHNNDDNSATLNKAENLAGGVGMTMHTSRTRGGAPATFGYRNGYDSNTSQRPSLSFLHWDAATETAHLCLYLYTGDMRVDDRRYLDGNRRIEDPRSDPQYNASQNELPREHIIPVELKKLGGVNPNTYGAQFGWVFDLDLTSVYNDLSLRADAANVVSSLLYVEQLSGGNWNLDTFTGQPERINFSRTPSLPGTYEFKGVFSSCLEGFKASTSTPAGRTPVASYADMCNGGATVSVERSVFVDLTPPPGAGTHDFARLTGPTTDGLPQGFGIVRGTSDFAISWTQPAANPKETVKGYVLSIARPGDAESMHQQYIVTDESLAEFDGRAPCDDSATTGADGDAPACVLPVSLPLASGGPTPIDVSGKYDVTLITVYADGHRTDGRCDDGTPAGVPCDPTVPKPKLTAPGVSQWQVLVRPETWPNVYASVQDSKANCCPAGEAPEYVLLLDLGLQTAEMIRWNPLAAEDSFRAVSGTIQEIDGMILIDFSSGNIRSNAPSWRVEGFGDSETIGGVLVTYPWDVTAGNVEPFVVEAI